MAGAEFRAIQAELERLNGAIDKANRQIAEQTVTIDALQRILVGKSVVSRQDLERARIEALARLKRLPAGGESSDA